MPDPVTDASPSPPGTNLDQGGKPGGGNTPPGTGQEALPVSHDRPSYDEVQSQLAQQQQENVTLKKNYSDSSRSAQAWQTQAQQAVAENERLRQAGQPTNQDVPVAPSTGALERARQLKDAVYAEDDNAIARTIEGIQSDASAQNQKTQQKEAARQQRLSLTWSYLQPHWSNLSNQNSADPLVARTWQYYQYLDQMQNSGSKIVEDDPIIVPGTETPGVPNSGVKMNLHLLKEAHSRALSESYAPQPNTQSAAQGDVPLEGSGGGTGGPRPVQQGGSDLDLLDEGEKATAKLYFSGTDEESQQKYFDNLPERVKKVRKSTGRVVTESDLMEGDVAIGAE
tara:strand:+ start:629 stop:1645 length:1017 start_codon:yes stop_codon:yes gene_type:complete